MLSLSYSKSTFDRGIQRAKASVALYKHFSAIAPAAMSCDDLLRGAIVFSSSAFDLLHHQAFRALLTYRISKASVSFPYVLPTSIVHMPLEDAIPVIDRQIKDSLSHRSFLQPDKISELYAPLVPSFWQTVSEIGTMSHSDLKNRVRTLAEWRNRIVHESDINPDLSGIEEWPILVSDAEAAVTDYDIIGSQIINVLSGHLI